ncbi:RTX toxin [Mesorhizobium sp. WSM4962]|uniref:RTX toxin n=1 Tax=Mesorhizobium sp. WSM4962 TaxID=3038548 RepID=UPI002416B261|nr:RTX toxin [Mesorhizobium sp. WSM4962]MDG4900578.1 RTX toxin [Mesorhizobium sp. WSM4962]
MSAFTVTSALGADPVFETRVASAGDDVEEKGSGAISTNISDLELGFDSSTRQTVGIRFTGIDIPKGAIITNAYIQFQANEVKTGAASLLIQGDNVDDASPFTTANFNVSSLPRTKASTAWTPEPWTTVGEHGLAERTPDLTAIVQEIVNRSGWAALNDIAFLITGTGTRTADSYEYNPASAPLLHIEYILPGSGNPVAFNTPADADPTANQIAELAAAGAPTGITASATDPDAGSTVTYSLNDARFAISNAGVITRSAVGTLDFETQSSINLTVTATSSDGSTANQGFTLAVLDSPEPIAFNTPPDANSAANQIGQNAAAGTAVGITASAKDPDAGSTVTYTIDDTRFAINSSTGVITRSGNGTLNAQSEPTINLQVTATSSDGSSATSTFTVGVTAGQQPVAFNTPADNNSAANQIAELAAAGAPTGITASASDPDAGSMVTYSINDTRFAINSSTGVITRSGTGTLDFETQPSINLTVTATSSDGSTANKSFTLAVLDSPEPVKFSTSPDANTAANQIFQNAAAGTAVGITASAKDPDAGSTVTYTIDDSRFAINSSTGVITRSGTGTLNAQSEPTVDLHVTATSSDGSTDTHAFTVAVTATQLPTSVTLAHTILTSQWSPPSPDPTDIVYISHLGTLLVADSEVEEMSIFTGKNLFQMNLNGTLTGTLTTINFSDEPAGVTYNPANHHLFFSDDTGTKSVYELNPGNDGLYNTSDDIVTSFRTAAFGSTDSESIAYDTNRGVLYLLDGSTHSIYTIAPGQNGKFDGVPSTGGDDVVTSFSVASLGAPSDGGIAYDPTHDLLYVLVSRTSVAMVTPTGNLLGTLDISAANSKKPAGLALAPSSDDPSHQMSLYVVDRGVDNDSNPTENDGKIYEFHVNDWLLA